MIVLVSTMKYLYSSLLLHISTISWNSFSTFLETQIKIGPRRILISAISNLKHLMNEHLPVAEAVLLNP